jgi:hypothetical protein
MEGRLLLEGFTRASMKLKGPMSDFIRKQSSKHTKNLFDNYLGVGNIPQMGGVGSPSAPPPTLGTLPLHKNHDLPSSLLHFSRLMTPIETVTPRVILEFAIDLG